MIPLSQLKFGENACIESIEIDKIPLKLIEMGKFTRQLYYNNSKSSI